MCVVDCRAVSWSQMYFQGNHIPISKILNNSGKSDEKSFPEIWHSFSKSIYNPYHYKWVVVYSVMISGQI